jgi:hypothetical protein
MMTAQVTCATLSLVFAVIMAMRGRHAVKLLEDWGLRFGHCNAATERWHVAGPRLITPYAHTKENLTVSDAEELAALIVKG